MEVDESNEQHVEYKVEIARPRATDDYILDDENILHCVRNKPFILNITHITELHSKRFVSIQILNSRLRPLYRCRKHSMEDDCDDSIRPLLIRFLNEHLSSEKYNSQTRVIKTILNPNLRMNEISMFVTCSHECLKKDAYIALSISDEQGNDFFHETNQLVIHESVAAMDEYVANEIRHKVDNSTLKIPPLSGITLSFEELHESTHMSSGFLKIILDGLQTGVPRMGHHLQTMIYSLREYNVTICGNGNQQRQTKDDRH